MNKGEVSGPPGWELLSHGMALLASGKHEQALIKIEGALRSLPDLPMAHIMRSCALAGLGKHEEALCELLGFPAPEDAGWHAHLITSYSRTGRHKEALDAGERAVAFAPDDALVWYRKGCAERRAVEQMYEGKLDNPKLLEEAEGSLRKSVALKPDNYMAHLELGWLFRHRRPAEAGQFCKTALDLKFGDPRMHMLAAELALDAGRRAEAREHLELVIAAAPGDQGALSTLYRLQLAERSALYRGTQWLGRVVLRYRWIPIALGLILAMMLIRLGVNRNQFFLMVLSGAIVWWAYWIFHQKTFERWKKAPSLSRDF